VETEGAYRISFDIADSEGGLANVWVDGEPVRTGLDCPAGGGTEFISVTFLPGVHAIRVQAASGGFELVRLIID
jgi:hypothetical protein